LIIDEGTKNKLETDENADSNSNCNSGGLNKSVNDEHEIEESLSEIVKKSLVISKTILNLSKLLVDIVKEDSQSQVKDLSVEILLLLKRILEIQEDSEAMDKYEDLIYALPIFRVNMIKTGKTQKNKNESNQNFEKEYKASLNRINSCISIGIRNKSAHKLSGIGKRQFASRKERSSKSGFGTNTNNNMRNAYKAIETDSGFFNKRNNNHDLDEEEIEEDIQQNENYNYSDQDYETTPVIRRNRNKRSLIKSHANRSGEKNKLTNNKNEKQEDRKINSGDDQKFINKYKKLNQKEKEKENKIKNDSKSKQNDVLFIR